MSIKSLLPPDEQAMLEDKTVNPVEKGNHPNFNNRIDFKVNLPSEALFTPNMTCTVHDQVFMGMSQPTIGSFHIPIGDIMHEQNKMKAFFEQRA